MKDRYLVYKLAIIAVLMIAGMTVDYRTRVIVEANPQLDSYTLFSQPQDSGLRGGK